MNGLDVDLGCGNLLDQLCDRESRKLVENRLACGRMVEVRGQDVEALGAGCGELGVGWRDSPLFAFAKRKVSVLFDFLIRVCKHPLSAHTLQSFLCAQTATQAPQALIVSLFIIIINTLRPLLLQQRISQNSHKPECKYTSLQTRGEAKVPAHRILIICFEISAHPAKTGMRMSLNHRFRRLHTKRSRSL